MYDPDIGSRFIPDLRVRIEHESGGYLLRTNDAGFRCNHEFRTEREPNKARALLFGDSFTQGTGVNANQRYGERLEDMVPGLEVYNFGLRATGPDQHLMAYRSVGRKFDHDLVIIGLWIENIVRVVSRYRYVTSHRGGSFCAPMLFFELDEGELILRNHPVPREFIPLADVPKEERRHVAALPTSDRRPKAALLQARNAIAARMHVRPEGLPGYSRREVLPGYRRSDTPDWLLLRAILQQWEAESHTPVLLMLIPMPQHVRKTASPTNYQNRFGELAAEEGLEVHDTLADTLAVPAADRRLFHYSSDGHPTPAYHEVLAGSVAPKVEELLARGSSS